MPQEYESWSDVEHQERQNILPSFEPKERRRSSRAATIGRGAGTVAFTLAIVAALIEGWWIPALCLITAFDLWKLSE